MEDGWVVKREKKKMGECYICGRESFGYEEHVAPATPPLIQFNVGKAKTPTMCEVCAANAMIFCIENYKKHYNENIKEETGEV